MSYRQDIVGDTFYCIAPVLNTYFSLTVVWILLMCNMID